MKEITQVSANGIAFLVQEEGLVKRPYLDSAGIPTIGIGCTYYEDGRKVKMTDPPISEERAISIFRNLLKNYELGVYSVTRDDISQNEFDALVSLCFNIGVAGFKGSTLLKRVNARASNASIEEAFLMWRKAGGEPVLLGRRKREAAFYFLPESKAVKSAEETYKDPVKHIQTMLGITADGIFGKNTKAAVIEFQKKHKLDPDGIVGSKTLAVLNSL